MNPSIPEPLPSQRDLFDLPREVAYLNCANMSPQSHSVTKAGLEAVRRMKAPWKISPSDWFTDAEALRAVAARLMGADTDGVALIPAASYGISIAASNVPIERGQNIVLLDEQFPSNLYAWRELARVSTAEVRTVHKEPLDAWTGAVLEAIDDDTAVVTVPNCHWTDGALIDLIQVGERARSVGAALVVDASQSLGAYPLDIAAIQPDFLVSVGYKWQLGPYGLGYLYAAPRWRETGRPLEASWLTRAGAEDFAALVDYVDDYRPGARRFDMGEYPQFVLAPMAFAGLSQLLDWGVGCVQATLSRLTNQIAKEVTEMGCSVLPADHRVGHLVGVRLPDGSIPEALPKRLAEEQVFVSARGDSLRIAPHVYNEDADVERLLAVLREFV
ncbi:aminotransferase class V-fold PLP-dependent enzyme [Litchfieldella rifensis]|uniref:Aminotransferase class V-fold PLP-dependent enzyme n=1 Tax=Litchfieldella rifensis TaxID=762643 RepID=A0ABV7LQT8_9GAMM